MIKTRGVCHFTIAVTDSRRSTAFYTDLLGFRLLRANHDRGMVFLDTGGDCLVLMKTDSTVAPMQNQLASSPGGPHLWKKHRHLYTEAMRAVVERAT